MKNKVEISRRLLSLFIAITIYTIITFIMAVIGAVVASNNGDTVAVQFITNYLKYNAPWLVIGVPFFTYIGPYLSKKFPVYFGGKINYKNFLASTTAYLFIFEATGLFYVNSVKGMLIIAIITIVTSILAAVIAVVISRKKEKQIKTVNDGLNAMKDR